MKTDIFCPEHKQYETVNILTINALALNVETETCILGVTFKSDIKYLSRSDS